MANKERIKEVVEWIEYQQKTNPKFVFNMDVWMGYVDDQGYLMNSRYTSPRVFDNGEPWSCGTNACLAGSAALMKNMPFVIDQYGEIEKVFHEGETKEIEAWAREFFELTIDEADNIFSPYNDEYDSPLSLEDVKERINSVLKEEVF